MEKFLAPRPPVLILGIGNILMRDEGIGPRMIEYLQELELSEDVELLDGGTAGADLIDVLSNRRKVVVIDAMDSDDPPGTIRRLRPEELQRAPAESLSLHELSLPETLAMAKLLNCAPAEVVIIGIQPEVVEPGLELSSTIEQLMPKIFHELQKELSQQIRGKSSP